MHGGVQRRVGQGGDAGTGRGVEAQVITQAMGQPAQKVGVQVGVTVIAEQGCIVRIRLSSSRVNYLKIILPNDTSIPPPSSAGAPAPADAHVPLPARRRPAGVRKRREPLRNHLVRLRHRLDQRPPHRTVTATSEPGHIKRRGPAGPPRPRRATDAVNVRVEIASVDGQIEVDDVADFG